MEKQVDKFAGAKWDDISQAETVSKPLIDPGEGEPVVLRHFFFKSAIVPPGHKKPTKAQIFGQFKNLVFTNLWADGLKPREDAPVEVHSRREIKTLSKQLFAEMVGNGSDIVIQVLAERQKGVMMLDRPTIL